MEKEAKKNLIIGSAAILVAIVLAGIFVFYLANFYSSECFNFECFKNSMERCERTKYVNEQPEASWGYEIKGIEGNTCEVEVTLLLAKEGELGIEDLEGKKMNCFYSEGLGTYPEKDLRNCRGELKEDIQQIIIEKLHSYIVENLGQIDQEINSL